MKHTILDNHGNTTVSKPVHAYKKFLENWDIRNGFHANRYRVLGTNDMNEVIGAVDLNVRSLSENDFPALFQIMDDLGAKKIIIGEKRGPKESLYPGNEKIKLSQKLRLFGETCHNIIVSDIIRLKRSHYFSYADNIEHFRYE